MKIAVIGGGIFGITAAIVLGKENHVELFEKNDDLLKSASGSNQYRVHRGYHYPRSPETVVGIIKSENSFKELFSEAIITNFEHFYCISKNNSLTSSKQFINFCTKYQLEIEKTNLDCVNKDSIDLCVRVKESVYDPKILKKISIDLLNNNNVKIHLNTKATESILDKFDKVIVCTYANLNELLNKFPDFQHEYQFELCEKPVVKLPVSFKDKSIVIMDGPFMCIDPLANTDLHLLCNVQHEIHQTNVGKFHENNPSIKFNINTKIPNNIILNQLESKIESYLDVLRVDHLETIMFHSFESYVKNEEILTKLVSLKNNGIIKNIGVSVYKNIEIENLLIDDSISVVQLPFNLLDNLNLKKCLFKKLKEKNKLIHTRSAFLQGLFFKDLNDKNRIVQQLKAELDLLKKLALEYNCSIEQLAISYCYMQKEVDSVILGVDSLDHLNLNLKAANFNLTNEILEKINKIKIKDVNLLNPSLW